MVRIRIPTIEILFNNWSQFIVIKIKTVPFIDHQVNFEYPLPFCPQLLMNTK